MGLWLSGGFGWLAWVTRFYEIERFKWSWVWKVVYVVSLLFRDWILRIGLELHSDTNLIQNRFAKIRNKIRKQKILGFTTQGCL